VHSPKEIESIGPEPSKFISKQIEGKWLFCDCTEVSLPQRSAGRFSQDRCPRIMARKSTNTNENIRGNISNQTLKAYLRQINDKSIFRLESYLENAHQLHAVLIDISNNCPSAAMRQGHAKGCNTWLDCHRLFEIKNLPLLSKTVQPI
jgi:hypothetical protein